MQTLLKKLFDSLNISKRSLFVIFLLFLFSCATSARDTDRSSAHYQLGLSYINENKMQLAFVELQKAVELNSDNTEALNALGIVYLEFDDLQKAEETFLKVISLDQNYSEAYNNLVQPTEGWENGLMQSVHSRQLSGILYTGSLR